MHLGNRREGTNAPAEPRSDSGADTHGKLTGHAYSHILPAVGG